MLVAKLLEDIKKEDEGTGEAALILGLLIEREKIKMLPSDDTIKMVLKSEYHQYRLAPSEIETAIVGLIQYIENSQRPHPTAIWALTKTHDPSILPVLIALFKKIGTDLEQENAAYQTFVGITSFHSKESLEIIRKATKVHSNSIREMAKQYLNIFENSA